MKNEKNGIDSNENPLRNDGERGSAIVIALFVLVLLAAFVALATTRTASEAISVANETAEGRALYAAQGSLEMMTRKLNNIYGKKLRATESDLNAVRDDSEIRSVEGFDRYTFDQKIGDLYIEDNKKYEVIKGGAFAGLQALRSPHRLSTTVTDPQGIQVELARNVIVNRIPIFQFGIFYDDDLELYRPPLFSFGGRVHSNRHFFLSPGPDGVFFDSRITAVGHIVTESWRSGYSGDTYNTVRIKDALGNDQILAKNQGSVANNAGGDILRYEPAPKCPSNEVTDFPRSVVNPTWSTNQARFGGNLQNRVPELKLPLKVGTNCASQGDLIEILKRPKNTGIDVAVTAATKNSTNPTVTAVTAANADDEIMRGERYANKPGIRISLADTKRRLPGCAALPTNCGVNLLTYTPRAMLDTYQATRLNNAIFSANLPSVHSTEGPTSIWVKVETVDVDDISGEIITKDITEEFISLGVTELPARLWVRSTNDGTCPSSGANSMPNSSVCFAGSTQSLVNNGFPDSPSSLLTATTPQTASRYPDSRSIIKLQRYEIPGRIDTNYRLPSTPFPTPSPIPMGQLAYAELNHQNLNIETAVTRQFYYYTGNTPGVSKTMSLKDRNGNFNTRTVVPVPIKMFDGREGLYYDERSATYYPSATFGNLGTDFPRLSNNGVMSLIDIDIANFRRFLRGDFNGLFPSGTVFADENGNSLRNTDIPEDGGWVLYLSDRRGDYDFDGEYDMEDIYGSSSNIGNDGVLQNGEDVNGDGTLNRRFANEAARYDNTIIPANAAVTDHRYYRRGIRLINGTVLPGVYDPVNESNTKGFTVASENGVYVKGNYNATHVTNVPTSGNTAYDDYSPFDTATHIPASIVADGVTILSNAWNDAQSFTTALRPPDPSMARVASNTTIRFAMIAGDTIATAEASPHQGGISPRMNGGVHNFKRFLEHWTGQRLDYSGSLINLFNSRNANGSFKCCNLIYDPPRRNWVFDSTFLNPNRLPPGTPMFHYVQTTGFMRTTE